LNIDLTEKFTVSSVLTLPEIPTGDFYESTFISAKMSGALFLLRWAGAFVSFNFSPFFSFQGTEEILSNNGINGKQ
jgi:hypothetical protein